ncbi:MAG: queuosine precursor transporter [Candidatus Nomurabacteria bacterium]|nr:queuosine precursor transporter [Candidatus Nomurabacteria bacterium]USN87730.1 MAG: queuosine precursor transporter [Candidatus Nomurabacteria bacterium]
MPNEVIFFLILSIDLALILFAFRLGKEWLFAAIAANMIIVNFTSSLLIPLFGFVASAAAVTYAAIFLATDILTEHYGKKEGYKSVWIAFTMTLLFVVITQLVLSFDSISDTASLSESMRKALEASPRIALAGLTAYLVAQNFDIWFYHLIHSKTGPRLLWLRNNLSTMVSQAIDSVIFFSIAFVGVLPFVVIVQLIITGYVAKLVVAVIDTPFVYLSYLIKKK